VELRPKSGGTFARSAGSAIQLVAKEGEYATLKMPSGELRMVHRDCWATIGPLDNAQHKNITLGKAGRKRYLGYRPTVRGMVMNPIDHPMGGGEGKKSGGHPRSRKGLYTKGKKTRRRKQTDRLIIERKKK
ncbi:MAG: 50S ribosomal protein L2, partial [Bacteroidetes bacterium SW_10_40_5]